jgi:hypothetical protein
MSTFLGERLVDEGAAGKGLILLLTFVLSLDVFWTLRLFFRVRAGLGLVRFVLDRSTGLGVDRLGGLAEDPLAMSCQTVEPGLRRKPSPREERGARGTRGVPLLRKRPKRDARAAPPRQSGRRADPNFPRQGAGSSHLAPGLSRPKRGDRLLQSAGTGPFGHPVGAPPPPLKRHSSLRK